MKHISVCICTYRRPQQLAVLLRGLCLQNTEGLFTYSIVVADNDRGESGRAVVEEVKAHTTVSIVYCAEHRQGIALARNAAVTNASGDFVALIDDDEEPCSDWLKLLLACIESFGADGALGPVLPRFLTPPPQWIIRGGFFDRPSHPTGTWLRWKETRSGNVLLRKDIFGTALTPFKEEYVYGGEDLDFFRRMMITGRRFVWCSEATVHEVVPPERWSRRYLLKRALARGHAPYNLEAPQVVKSLFAVPAYAVALPFLLLCGHHVFMRYLVKECNHVGRLFALLGIDFLGSYVTQ